MNNQPYVYLATPNGDETYIYTVGFYQPAAGQWYPVSDHSEEEEAAERVHYLNGGEQLAKVKAILSSTETELRGADLLIEKLKAQVSTMECALEEAREYFAERADVRDGPEGCEHEQRPNEAMRLMMQVDDALGRVS
jgi:hypothetical protein